MSGHRIKLLILLSLSACFTGYSMLIYLTPANRETATQIPMAERGKILWQRKNCQACHQLYGLGGHLGPDLTNIYGEKPVGFIKAFLKSGTNVMPNFHLTDSEVNELVAFLQYTNSTGTADPKSFKRHLNGTVSQ